jgi:hypothetical protein
LDYAGSPDNYKSTGGLVSTVRGAVNWRSRNQMSAAQSTTDAEYYAFGVGCMRFTQISHLLNELGIPTILHMFSELQSLIASIRNRLYCGTAVAHIPSKYYLAADMARDREIDLSYIPTAEMLVNFFTKPLPKSAFLQQCAAMGMIEIGLSNGFGNSLRNCVWFEIGNGIRSSLGNGHGNHTGTGNAIRNAVGKEMD